MLHTKIEDEIMAADTKKNNHLENETLPAEREIPEIFVANKNRVLQRSDPDRNLI